MQGVPQDVATEAPLRLAGVINANHSIRIVFRVSGDLTVSRGKDFPAKFVFPSVPRQALSVWSPLTPSKTPLLLTSFPAISQMLIR